MHIVDRVKELRRVRASELKPNPRNWRTHPARQQDALRGVLADVGFANAVVARELDDGSLELVDGHLRVETAGDAVLPVLVVDLTDDQATKVLLTHDALAGMAGVDADNLASLLGDVQFDNQAVETMLAEVAQSSANSPPLPVESAAEVEIPELYQVTVECEDESQQQELFERLRDEGFRCRLMTL